MKSSSHQTKTRSNRTKRRVEIPEDVRQNCLKGLRLIESVMKDMRRDLEKHLLKDNKN